MLRNRPRIIGYRRNGAPIHAITGGDRNATAGQVGQATAPAESFLGRLLARQGEDLAGIDTIVQRDAAENRDELTADEDAEVARLQAAHDALTPQVERFTTLRQAGAD